MTMQAIRNCVQRYVSRSILNTHNTNCFPAIERSYHEYKNADDQKEGFLKYNKIVFPPQKPGEPERPGYVCHAQKNIKCSPLKMWYIACFVRGMSVDEAVKQLSFMKQKGAAIAKEIILEAQRMAVEEHNIEFKSNLWVAESFSTKGYVIKGMRRHARGVPGRVDYRYCHYYVRLEEGKPPKNYYAPVGKSGEEMLKDWMRMMHNRKVHSSL